MRKLKTFGPEIKKLLRLVFSISLGVFLFILFFQPVNLDHFDFNSKLLLIAGCAGITFFLLVAFLQILPEIFPKIFNVKEWEAEPDYFTATLIFILHSTAYAFYIRFVGSVYITMYIMFKLALIGLLPVVILWIHYKLRWLNNKVEKLTSESKALDNELKETNKNLESRFIEFLSVNQTEKLNLKLADIVTIKSADNYVEIIYRQEEQFRKKLIRNTLRNIEVQLKDNPDFIRCHRTCIVNKNLIEKISKKYPYHIVIQDYTEEIPVSRQYILKVKEALEPV